MAKFVQPFLQRRLGGWYNFGSTPLSNRSFQFLPTFVYAGLSCSQFISSVVSRKENAHKKKKKDLLDLIITINLHLNNCGRQKQQMAKRRLRQKEMYLIKCI